MKPFNALGMRSAHGKFDYDTISAKISQTSMAPTPTFLTTVSKALALVVQPVIVLGLVLGRNDGLDLKYFRIRLGTDVLLDFIGLDSGVVVEANVGEAEAKHFQLCPFVRTRLVVFAQRNIKRTERRGDTVGIWHSKSFPRTMVKYARKTSIRRVRLPDRSPKRVKVTSYSRRNRRK